MVTCTGIIFVLFFFFLFLLSFFLRFFFLEREVTIRTKQTQSIIKLLKSSQMFRRSSSFDSNPFDCPQALQESSPSRADFGDRSNPWDSPPPRIDDASWDLQYPEPKEECNHKLSGLSPFFILCFLRRISLACIQEQRSITHFSVQQDAGTPNCTLKLATSLPLYRLYEILHEIPDVATLWWRHRGPSFFHAFFLILDIDLVALRCGSTATRKMKGKEKIIENLKALRSFFSSLNPISLNSAIQPPKAINKNSSSNGKIFPLNILCYSTGPTMSWRAESFTSSQKKQVRAHNTNEKHK